MQNWNDGKAQEFKDRKEYDIANSHLNRTAYVAEMEAEPCTSCETQAANGEVLLFATKTCPNCKQAEKLLNEANIAFTKVLAEENADLARKFGIRQAPTIIIDGEQPAKLVGLGGVRKFIDEFSVKH